MKRQDYQQMIADLHFFLSLQKDPNYAHLTGEKKAQAFALETMTEYVPGKGTVDQSATQRTVQRAIARYRRGQQLYNEGWRLRYGKRRMIGQTEIENGPDHAVASTIFSAGYIATSPAVRTVWLYRQRERVKR